MCLSLSILWNVEQNVSQIVSNYDSTKSDMDVNDDIDNDNERPVSFVKSKKLKHMSKSKKCGNTNTHLYKMFHQIKKKMLSTYGTMIKDNRIEILYLLNLVKCPNTYLSVLRKNDGDLWDN
ncbi:hypothetical protein BLOT_015682, partial [Blomia tropicalis]